MKVECNKRFSHGTVKANLIYTAEYKDIAAAFHWQGLLAAAFEVTKAFGQEQLGQN